MGEQGEIPGTERPHGDKKLDALMVELKNASKKRKRAQDAEVDQIRQVVERMKEKGFTVYENPNVIPKLVARLTTKDKVKVTAEDADSSVEVDEGEE